MISGALQQLFQSESVNVKHVVRITKLFPKNSIFSIKMHFLSPKNVLNADDKEDSKKEINVPCEISHVTNVGS